MVELILQQGHLSPVENFNGLRDAGYVFSRCGVGYGVTTVQSRPKHSAAGYEDENAPEFFCYLTWHLSCLLRTDHEVILTTAMVIGQQARRGG